MPSPAAWASVRWAGCATPSACAARSRHWSQPARQLQAASVSARRSHPGRTRPCPAREHRPATAFAARPIACGRIRHCRSSFVPGNVQHWTADRINAQSHCRPALSNMTVDAPLGAMVLCLKKLVLLFETAIRIKVAIALPDSCLVNPNPATQMP